MSLHPRNRWLLALALALGLATFLAARGGPTPVERGAWLAGLDPAAVALVRIRGAGGEVELAREASGWVVASRARFPAEGGAVDELLQRLAGIRATDRISSDPSAHERLGVGAGAERIALLGAGGAPIEELLVGRAEESRGGVSLRRASGDEVFRLATLALPESDPAHWLEARLADFAPPAVRRFAASVDGARFELVRLTDGRWQAAGNERLLAPARVEPVLLVAANLFLEDLADVEGETAGLGPSATTVELVLADGRAVRLELGGELAGGARAARRGDFAPAWIARLPRTAAERLEAGLREILADLEAAPRER